MNNLQIFKNEQFGEVRTIQVNNETYFVGVDIARSLGYSKPSQAVINHCKGILNLRIPSKGGVQKTNCIPIGDLFRLGANSELPGAAQFESWIFDEVLPTLHRTGRYEMPNAGKGMTEYQKMMAETRSENTKIRKAQLLTKLARQYKGTTYEQVLNSYATKELTGEHILPLPELGEKTYSATDIGEMLGVSAQKIGRLSEKHGMKIPEYGKYFHDKSRHSAKEIPSFRYYENAIEVFKHLLDSEVA